MEEMIRLVIVLSIAHIPWQISMERKAILQLNVVDVRETEGIGRVQTWNEVGLKEAWMFFFTQKW